MQIKFMGAERLNAKLREMAARCPREMARFMAQEAEVVKNRTKALTPVDTGRLRGSWTSTVSGNTAEIFTAVHYAPYVEFGHRVKIRGRYTGAVVPGQYMLRGGVEGSAAAFQRDAQAILARIFA